MIGNKRRQNGFSLLEVLIAMSLLMFGLLAIVTLFETGAKALQIGDKRTLASRMAQNKIEALRLSNPTLFADGEDFPMDGVTARWTFRASAADPKIEVVTVTVFWKDIQGKDQTLSLKRFLIK